MFAPRRDETPIFGKVAIDLSKIFNSNVNAVKNSKDIKATNKIITTQNKVISDQNKANLDAFNNNKFVKQITAVNDAGNRAIVGALDSIPEATKGLASSAKYTPWIIAGVAGVGILGLLVLVGVKL